MDGDVWTVPLYRQAMRQDIRQCSNVIGQLHSRTVQAKFRVLRFLLTSSISLSFGRPYVMQSSEAWLPCSPLYYGLGSPSLQDYGLGQPAFLNRALLVISYCYRQDISLRQIHLRVV